MESGNFEQRRGADKSRRREMSSGQGRMSGEIHAREVWTGTPEKTTEEAKKGSLFERWITPDQLTEVKGSRYGDNRSPESLLLERLTGVLVESAPGWDPQAKQRLRTYVNALRIAAYPNMLPHEQESIRITSENNPGAWQENLIDPEAVKEELQWTWQAFGFEVPDSSDRGDDFDAFHQQLGLDAKESSRASDGSDLENAERLAEVIVPAVQVVLVRTGEDGSEVFLGKRKAGGFLDQWSVPGGKVDEGEGKKEAAMRELNEETGVDVEEDEVVHFRDATSTTIREKNGERKLYTYDINVFVVDAHNLDPQNASPDEHSEMKWMPISEALAMHERVIAEEEATAEPRSPDKIPGALAPRTYETLTFLSGHK